MSKENAFLKELGKKIDRIDARIYPWWKMLLMGTIHGVGTVVGAAIVIFILGVILNVLGYLPIIGDIAKGFKALIENYRP
ncbi:hypothetical protein H6775_02055 [Candidatus Nomurabacteria bacterium]|nr:hypothetical protein [Candidatus Nomurabacteria bacterium]